MLVGAKYGPTIYKILRLNTMDQNTLVAQKRCSNIQSHFYYGNMFEPCTPFRVTITTSNYNILPNMFKRVYKYKYLSKKINILKYIDWYSVQTVICMYIDIEHKEAYFYDLFYIFLITLLYFKSNQRLMTNKYTLYLLINTNMLDLIKYNCI